MRHFPTPHGSTITWIGADLPPRWFVQLLPTLPNMTGFVLGSFTSSNTLAEPMGYSLIRSRAVYSALVWLKVMSAELQLAPMYKRLTSQQRTEPTRFAISIRTF